MKTPCNALVVSKVSKLLQRLLEEPLRLYLASFDTDYPSENKEALRCTSNMANLHEPFACLFQCFSGLRVLALESLNVCETLHAHNFLKRIAVRPIPFKGSVQIT